MSRFEVVLNELDHQLGLSKPEPLVGYEYSQAHERFEHVSPQQDKLRRSLKKKVLSFSQKIQRSVSIVSIGCGGGQLDLLLLDQLGDHVRKYVGIDINPHQIEIIKARNQGLAGREFVCGDFCEIEPTEKFDVVLAIHSIYYFENFQNTLHKFLDTKTANGKVILAVAPLLAMNRIASLFWNRQGTSVIFSEQILEYLDKENIDYSTERIDAHIPLSKYLGANKDQLVVDFTVDTNTANLPPNVRLALENTFIAASTGETEPRTIDHPVDLIVLS